MLQCYVYKQIYLSGIKDKKLKYLIVNTKRAKMIKDNILGIDVGSVAVSVVEISPEKKVIKHDYQFHKGDVQTCLKTILSDFDLNTISHIATTTSTPDFVQCDGKYDNQVAIIAAAKKRHDQFSYILSVGGEKFGLLAFDNEGNYSNYKANTSCAAGTGSFLDQQAGRLNLESIEQLSGIAYDNNNTFPMIASRCAVFAKTDLIHAQQEGYLPGEISDGLCYGLAKNIVDTLFCGMTAHGKIIFCGGVAKNNAVAEHIEELIGTELTIDNFSHLYSAIGAAFCLMDDVESLTTSETDRYSSVSDIIQKKADKRDYFYPPLALTLSTFPDFESLEKYQYKPLNNTGNETFVEVDIYETFDKNSETKAVIGVDIGSTSTKAALVGPDNNVLAGFYTRTAGNPLMAIRLILESINDIVIRKKSNLIISGCGTTGSGRKFIGRIIGADTIVDEITAHARAAYEINPEVDTIIEIGGQDAKFTTLRNGMVTASTMNNVCAAGTGSFIEEQAKKLGCNIIDYARRTENVSAPMASDRCTVFMERDLNHYLSEGYAVDEILTSVLHSVRENYLIKVATESNIGNTIFFQGATAKNKSLVAAFEQRLNKPILVSKFCHLTGAIGTALIILENEIPKTAFRGIDIYKADIPIESEVCTICNNNCKISVAAVGNEKVAYGFLCGRDYETKQYVNNKKSGYDLLRERKKTEKSKNRPAAEKVRTDKTIGIPASLYLFDDLAFWQFFFNQLSIKTVSSEKFKDAVKTGKNLSETEFCAPATAMYGHVDYLMDKADYIFLPRYLEKKSKNSRRQYCYYSQYIPSIVSKFDREKILTPLVRYLYTNFSSKVELYKMMKSIGFNISFFAVSTAYDKAMDYKKACSKAHKDAYKKELAKATESDDISIVFMGRPYTVLSPSVNCGIPDIFSSLGIKTFFQDMVPYSDDDIKTIEPLLKDMHWKYPADILKATEKIATAENVYPVYVTAFKCTPDSFGIRYFKELMNKHSKPYLILELDEHDSSVGYETRIEAAVRAFRNHSNQKIQKSEPDYTSLFLKPGKNIAGKNLVIPNWDTLTCRLLAATLRREGIKTYLIDETETTILKSMKFNSGQCMPANSIAQGFVETVEKNNLDPENTLLWIAQANFCNLRLYPNYIESLLHSYGNGMEKAKIFTGELTYSDISVRASINAYFSHMFGGMVRKMGCKIRPYEVEKGATDKVIEKSVEILEDAFLGNRSKEEAVAQVVSRFEWIETKSGNRPKVAVFGDLYVRDNRVMNQDLIRYIETNGGEVVTTPYTEIGKMIASMYYKKWFNEGLYFSVFSLKALVATMKILEKKYLKYFDRIIKETEHVYEESPEKMLAPYNVASENTGESMENLMKIHYLTKYYPDISLFVQASPAFCCPSIVTEAMKKEIETISSVPVISITYDGTGGIKNESIIPYLKYPRKRKQAAAESHQSTGGIMLKCL